MIEFVRVDSPALHPQTCIVCGSSVCKAGFMDTLAEQFIAGRDARVYLCGLCVKRSAAGLGYVKGEKADEVEHAIEVVAAKDAQLDELALEIREVRAALGQEQKRSDALQTLVDDARNREQTRTHLASEIASAAAALVTVGAPVLEQVA